MSLGGTAFRVYRCPCEQWQVEVHDPVAIPMPRGSAEGPRSAVDVIAWHTTWIDEDAALEGVLRDHAVECDVLRAMITHRRATLQCEKVVTA